MHVDRKRLRNGSVEMSLAPSFEDVDFRTAGPQAMPDARQQWPALPAGTAPRDHRYAARVAGGPLVHQVSDIVDEAAPAQTLRGLTRDEVEALRSRFDADWYLNEYPQAHAQGGDPFIHYMTSGWRELKDPSPHFSTRFYLERYADVRDHGMNPLLHWVIFGIAEGRSGERNPSSPLTGWEGLSAQRQLILTRMFSADYYHGHLAGTGLGRGSPIAARVASGRIEQGEPTVSFRASRYVESLSQSLNARQVPFLHFLFDTVGEEALRALFLDYTPEQVQAIGEHFDTAWYLYSYPDVEAAGYDAFIHYMTVGWWERRDPSPEFSTSAYLLRYMDIVQCGMNPFLHWVLWGKAEGRLGASFSKNFRSRPYAPPITAILVNTGEDPVSPNCLAGVLEQFYDDLTVLVVGAPLGDACRAILAGAARAEGRVVRDLTYDGSPSRWALLERAVEHATGELVWFIQGPGVHEADFLARLTSSFADGSVQLGFGRHLGPEERLVGAPPARKAGWDRHVTSPAAIWFPDHLRPEVLCAAQHGFLWRRRPLNQDVWRRADDYAYLGLWHLYLHMASGGQIASVRDAQAHLPSAPEPSFPSGTVDLDHEVARFAREVRSFWGADDENGSTTGIGRIRRHVLLVTHGIFAGGAENFPIQLANELAARGIIVSMLIFKTEDVNPEMRATLDPGVSIYEAEWAMSYGCDKFVRDIGCTLLHSHGVVGEMFFFERCDVILPVPYVATLHGSYEASTSDELPERVLEKFVRRVDLFVYTADKNLEPLLRHDVRPERLVKMINAMPIDGAPFPLTRKELGIAEDAIVFTLVARGISEKGWSTAIGAFKAVQVRNPQRQMHLCLVGEGDETKRLEAIHVDDPAISFLGFQLRIHGLYRLTDVAIVPTRFAGESFPLCIIQALQVAVPVVATDVGEIASMLRVDGVTGGVLVENCSFDDRFEADFAEAMDALADDEHRKRLGRGAAILGRSYDMSILTEQYVDLYEDVSRRFAADRSAPPMRDIKPEDVVA